jgi:hypothetical protein
VRHLRLCLPPEAEPRPAPRDCAPGGAAVHLRGVRPRLCQALLPRQARPANTRALEEPPLRNLPRPLRLQQGPQPPHGHPPRDQRPRRGRRWRRRRRREPQCVAGKAGRQQWRCKLRRAQGAHWRQEAPPQQRQMSERHEPDGERRSTTCKPNPLLTTAGRDDRPGEVKQARAGGTLRALAVP